MHLRMIHSKIPLSTLLILCVSFTACTAQHHMPYTIQIIKEDTLSANINESILFYINQYRQTKSLPALRLDTMLCVVALKHSINMAHKKVPFGHDGFNERMDFIMKKIPNMKASAENVAEGKLDAEAVVKGWLNSPPHKKNIEGNYNFTGIGVAKNKIGVSYFTQIFILE